MEEDWKYIWEMIHELREQIIKKELPLRNKLKCDQWSSILIVIIIESE